MVLFNRFVSLRFIIGGISVLIAVIAVWFYVGGIRNDLGVSAIEEISAHFYQQPDTSLAEIYLKMVYAVPQNKQDVIPVGWRDDLEETIQTVLDFHELQFRGASAISYDIFPEPVILREESLFYDSESTDGGNPRALISVADEIEERVFRMSGDLYRSDFAFQSDTSYPVLGLMYEGVGLSGGIILESERESVREIAAELGLPESMIFLVDVESVDGFFIFNSYYVTDSEAKIIGSTRLYHEFAHTLGLPDQYNEATGISFSNDIMGNGRTQPLEMTYIGRELLHDMGL